MYTYIDIDDENPPEYHTLGARVIAEAGTEPPPLDYYDAVVGTSPRTQGTLTSIIKLLWALYS